MHLRQILLRATLPFLPVLSLAFTPLSDNTLRNLPYAGDDFNIKDGALLAPILIPRVPGTPGSTAVLNHFVNFFRKNLPEWNLEFQNSSSTTPTSNRKEVPFVNLIATRDPPWAAPGDVGRLALVAHYDSKLTPEGFIGATDSAAPCAMLMHMARSLDGALKAKWDKMQKDGDIGLEAEKGLQIIFLDGEEAFQSWTSSDSLYGARSLAESWERSFHPAMSTYKNPLESIELFLLLDLLGAKDPRVPSYFKTTHWAYQAMAELEVRFRNMHGFKSSPNYPLKRSSTAGKRDVPEPLFLTDAEKQDGQFRSWMVQDDHIPFMARGVEVLHIIPTPFPKVWHEIEDDGEHLDLDTVEDWARLVTAFAGSWMDLEGFLDASTVRKVGDQPREGSAEHEETKRRRVTSKSEL